MLSCIIGIDETYTKAGPLVSYVNEQEGKEDDIAIAGDVVFIITVIEVVIEVPATVVLLFSFFVSLTFLVVLLFLNQSVFRILSFYYIHFDGAFESDLRVVASILIYICYPGVFSGLVDGVNFVTQKAFLAVAYLALLPRLFHFTLSLINLTECS